MKKMGIGHFGITQASLAFLTPPRRRERHGRLVEEGFCCCWRPYVKCILCNSNIKDLFQKLKSQWRDGRNVWDQEQNETCCVCLGMLPLDFYMLA